MTFPEAFPHAPTPISFLIYLSALPSPKQMRHFPLKMYSSMKFMEMQFNSTRGRSHNGVDGEQTSESFSDQDTGVPGGALHLQISFNDSTTSFEQLLGFLHFEVTQTMIQTHRCYLPWYHDSAPQQKKENNHPHCHSTTLDRYANIPCPDVSSHCYYRSATADLTLIPEISFEVTVQWCYSEDDISNHLGFKPNQFLTFTSSCNPDRL